MGKILDALAADLLCIAPSEYKGSDEYRRARDLSCKMEKLLLEKLSEEDGKLLEGYSDAQAEAHRHYANHLFAKGFRLGALLMMEVVTDADSLVLQEKHE